IILKLTIIVNNDFKHANILIYDVLNEYIERFDPYGKVPMVDNESIDRFLKSFFENFLSNVVYISLATDTISFQVFSDENNYLNYVENDPDGFCVAWCIWYIETRI